MLIFPDVERELVAYFQDALAARPEAVCEDVRVSVRKAAPSTTPYPSKELVITASLGRPTQRVLRDATATLDVYAPTYGEASELARIVDALALECLGDVFKKADVTISNVRTTEEGTSERRSSSLDLVVKATDA